MEKTYDITLADGTRCEGKFESEFEARDIYEILYGMEIDAIHEVEK